MNKSLKDRVFGFAIKGVALLTIMYILNVAFAELRAWLNGPAGLGYSPVYTLGLVIILLIQILVMWLFFRNK